VNPLAFTASRIPGVEDIIGEYRWGLASSRREEAGAGRAGAVRAGTMLHLPLTHPQLPAPQSIGPSQLMVHMTVSQGGTAALPVQLFGWQHSAGTQSVSIVQTCASPGVARTTVAEGDGAGAGVAAGGEPAVHPAVATITMQMRRNETIRASMYKTIYSGKYKQDVSARENLAGKN